MYNTYVGKIGFSVRKRYTKRWENNEGHRQIESSRNTTRMYCDVRAQFSVGQGGI
jgi:hypothetical protein